MSFNNKTHTFIAPNGTEYCVANIAALARMFNIEARGFYRLVSGSRNSYYRWTLKHLTCTSCGVTSADVSVQQDPYAMDVEGTDVNITVCETCVQRIADDI